MYEHTPIINRSDGKSFHLLLFDGPGLLYGKSGGVIAGRAAAIFNYASENIGQGTVLVIIRTINRDREGTVDAMESVADELAKIIESENRPDERYFYDERLSPLEET